MKFQLRSKYKNLISISARQKKLVLAVFWLTIYRNLLLLCGSKRAYSEHIYSGNQDTIVLTEEKIKIAKEISIAIHIVNKYLPWKNVCRHQSYQAVHLLLKYQIPFKYLVGVEKTKKITEAHSWVKVNEKFICGNCIEENYFLISLKKG